MFKDKRIRDIMDSSIVSLRSNMSLAEAVDRIIASHLHGLPVVDDERTLIGFISEHDCLRYLISSSYYLDSHITVSEIMHPEVISIKASDPVLKLAERMEKGKPKIYPVCEEGKLVGIITRSDVMKALNQTLKSTKVSI